MSAYTPTNQPGGAVTPPVTTGSQFRVIAGPRKGWHWIAPDGQTHEGEGYPDLRLVLDQDPRNVRRIHEYTTDPPGVLPERAGPWLKQLTVQLAQLRARGIDPSTVTFTLRDGHVTHVS